MNSNWNWTLVFFLVTILLACTTVSSTPPTPYKYSLPTSIPYPTYMPLPLFSEALLKDLQERVERDDTILEAGRNAIITLLGREPSYVFEDEPDIILQFTVEIPRGSEEIKKAEVLLIGTGVIAAGEHKIPLTGIGVVFLTRAGKSWFAMAPISP